MLGVIYLVLCMLIGKEPAGLLLSKKSGYNQIWLTLAAAFGTGVLIMGWATYMTAWAASEAGAVHPLIYANAVVMPVAVLIVVILYWKRYHKAGSFKGILGTGLITERRLFRKEAVFFGALLVFLIWIMFYVFFIKDGVLYSGYTVYGDYAPHTAMMRSFSMGNNFPTEYPHFGGQDVKYHFMFQFFVGNLEFLGLRLDFAYNVVSVLVLLGFLIFLYHMAKRLTGSFAAGVLTVFFFFFRSSLSFFRFVIEHLNAGDLWTTLRDNTTFIGYTTNENWGLWNFNVYLNQRHLAFGLLIVAIVLWVFMDWLEAGCSAPERGVHWIKRPHFYKESMALRAFRNCVACRNAPRSYFFLERGGSDRRTSDPDGICRVFRWEAGLSDSGGNISDFFCASDKDLYLGERGKSVLLLGIPVRKQKYYRSTLVSDPDERRLFCGSCADRAFSERTQAEGCTGKFFLSTDLCILYVTDSGHCSEPQIYYDCVCVSCNFLEPCSP